MELDKYFYKLYESYDDLAKYYNKLALYWENKQIYGKIKSILNKSMPFFVILYAIFYIAIIKYGLYFTTIKSALLCTLSIIGVPLAIGTLLNSITSYYKKKALNKVTNITPIKSNLVKEANILDCSILERVYTSRRNIIIDAQKKFNNISYPNNNKRNLIIDKFCLTNLENKLNSKFLELDYIEQKEELLTTKVLLNESYLFFKSLKATFKAGGEYFLCTTLISKFLIDTSITGLFSGINITTPWFIGLILSGIIGNSIYNKMIDDKIKVFNYINDSLREKGIDTTKSDFDLDKEFTRKKDKIINEVVSLLVDINKETTTISNVSNKKLSYSFTRGTTLDNNDIEDMTYDNSEKNSKLVRRINHKYY